MIIQVPTRTDGTAHYSMSMDLDGATYGLLFDWNDRDASWYMSIQDVNGNDLQMGIKLTLNGLLIDRYVTAGLPLGSFDLLDSSGTDKEAGLLDLGGRVQLFYLPRADRGF